MEYPRTLCVTCAEIGERQNSCELGVEETLLTLDSRLRKGLSVGEHLSGTHEAPASISGATKSKSQTATQAQEFQTRFPSC